MNTYENPFEDLRIGNIVDYYGSQRNDKYVRVSEIRIEEGIDTLYILQKPYGEDNTFAASTREIRPITLLNKHLEAVGIKYDTDSRRYSISGLNIGQFGYTEHNENGSRSVDLGFKVIPINFPIRYSIDQMKELPPSMFFLHDLQNFCTDNAVSGLDFSALR
jgi:hypothetical protein